MPGVGGESTKKLPTCKICNLFSAPEVAGLAWGNTQDVKESLRSMENYSTHN